MDGLTSSIRELPEADVADAGDFVEIEGPNGNRRLAVEKLGGGFFPLLLSVAIPANALSVAVVFPVPFSKAPARILCSITKPLAGDNVWANPVRESITKGGFTAELSGPPSIAGHTLDCLILL